MLFFGFLILYSQVAFYIYEKNYTKCSIIPLNINNVFVLETMF
jgi:hypothetical protein